MRYVTSTYSTFASQRIFLACNGRDIAECYRSAGGLRKNKINFEFSKFAKGKREGASVGKARRRVGSSLSWGELFTFPPDPKKAPADDSGGRNMGGFLGRFSSAQAPVV